MTIRSILGKNASFSIYEDEDTTYDYEKGAFSNIDIIYNEAKRKLSVGERKGNFHGMFKNWVFKIVWVSKTQPKELQLDNLSAEIIKYKRKEISVSEKSKFLKPSGDG